MKIKNIIKYRTFYKEEIRGYKDENRDENFIGTNYNTDNKGKVFGWFDIYHGDKEGSGNAEDGISGFLQSFLDMAKDGQAIYEFIQNAVDANSSHFTMIWDKDEIDGNDYLLIANNGEMFNFESVRSILNVGSSTKTSDSLNIGKFGIGFKLAHRLIGKDNGLEELLSKENPNGPLLFSWKNNEINNLADNEVLEPNNIDFGYDKNKKAEILNNDPWLFKFLITCFPYLPENKFSNEEIRLIDGSKSEASLFPTSEYNVLSRWVSKHINVFNTNGYKEGSLFFLKLGSGKEKSLADNNLKEGVKFSLAILNKTAEREFKKTRYLRTVQLNNNEVITLPKLEYHQFTISKETNLEEYIYIRFGVLDKKNLTTDQVNSLNKESDIEVLFGYRKYNEIGEYFKGAPNFYLYFPLSEEVHNFNFILHTNAFYKASSRTFLHKGGTGEDGINERLLRTISKNLYNELINIYKSKNKHSDSLFLDFYASLLTSNESINHDRLWIKGPFIDEISSTLRRLIPIKEKDNSLSLANESGTIYLKYTSIEIETWSNINEKWFYWDNQSDDIIKNSAYSKLNIKKYDIYKLLEIKNIYIDINEWLTLRRVIDKDETVNKSIINELDYPIENSFSSMFKRNIQNLEVFEFSNGEVLSINSINTKQNNGYIIIHNTLSKIKDILLLLNLKVTTIDFNTNKFILNYSNFMPTDSQLRGYDSLVKIFSKNISTKNIEKISIEEKRNIFRSFRDLSDDNRISRIKKLKLFKNIGGDIVYTRNLLSDSINISWLNDYIISTNDYFSELKQYLIIKEEYIYENIVFVFWNSIFKKISEYENLNQINVLDKVIELFNISNQKTPKNLSDKNLIFFKGDIIYSENIFFRPALSNIPSDLYIEIQSIILEKLSLIIPDKHFVPYCNKNPFKIEFTQFSLNKVLVNLSFKELSNLLSFCNYCEIDVFNDSKIIKNDEDKFDFVKIDDSVVYYSQNNKLIKYIDKYHPNFILLPVEFIDNLSLVKFKDQFLLKEIISNLSIADEQNVIELIDCVLEENLTAAEALFYRIVSLKIYSNWEDSNIIILKYLERINQSDEFCLKDIQDVIIVIDKDNEILLKDIDQANDQINIEIDSGNYSLSRKEILKIEDERGIQAIIELANKAIEFKVINSQFINELFKIFSEGITEELISIFNSKLIDNKIINSDQLAFVLLTNNNNTNIYLIKNENDKWVDLTGNFVIDYEREIEVFDKSKILNKDLYKNIKSLIRLKGNMPFDYSYDNTKISFDLVFEEFQFKQGFDINVFDSSKENIDIFSYLHSSWKNTPKNSVKNMSDQSCNEVFGYDFNDKVVCEYRVKTELLDDDIEDYIKSAKIEVDFLEKLGVNILNSNIDKLRKQLINKIDLLFDISLLGLMPKQLLKNTLDGLSGNFFNDNSPIIYQTNSDEYLKILKIVEILFVNSGTVTHIPIFKDVNSFAVIGVSNNNINYINLELFELLDKEVNHTILNDFISDTHIVAVNNQESQEYKRIVESNFNECVFDYKFKPDPNYKESKEHFYIKWKEQSRISLITQKDIFFNVSTVIDSNLYSFGEVRTSSFYVEKDHLNNTCIYYKEELSLERLSEFLHDDYRNESDLIIKFIQVRNKAYAILVEGIGKEDGNEFGYSFENDLLKNSIQKKSIEERRKEIVQDLLDSIKYSFKWFSLYLDYLISFDEIEETTSQKSITFYKIMLYTMSENTSDKYYILRGANGLIPPNIETYNDFSISVVLSNKKEHKIIVEGVSKKGQDLLVYAPNGISIDLTSNFDKVVSVSINFTPTLNLLVQLKKAFINLPRWEDIFTKLPGIHFIYGPPGTGKTTKIAKFISDEFESKVSTRSLILTPTNKAGDVIAKKILSYESGINIVRLSSPTDPELLELDDTIYKPNLNETEYKDSNIIISTIHRLPYYKVSSDESLFLLTEFEKDLDYIILDEASMINLPYIIFGIMKLGMMNPSAKIIVAGDPKQIPPVINASDGDLEKNDMDDENIYKMLDINSFNKNENIIRDIDTIEFLDIQYRSLKSIGNLYSNYSYGGLLKHFREDDDLNKKVLPSIFINELKESIVQINFPIDVTNQVLSPLKLLYSSYQAYVGILVSEIIKHLDDCNLEQTKYTIGIISPYKAQALLIGKLITALDISINLNIYCDTVHGFQGEECDIIIFVVNPNNIKYTGHTMSLLSKEYIYNVAISRAKDYLWILNPYSDINNPHLSKIKEINKKENNIKTIIKSSSIENHIFNDKNFIVNNSYLTGHDSINVFGQVDMKYFLKAGHSAIDIQLRKG